MKKYMIKYTLFEVDGPLRLPQMKFKGDIEKGMEALKRRMKNMEENAGKKKNLLCLIMFSFGYGMGVRILLALS